MPDITWYLNKAPEGGMQHPAYTNAFLGEGEIFTYHKSWADQQANPPNPTETIKYKANPSPSDALNGYRTYVDIWVAPKAGRFRRWTKIVIDETLLGCSFAMPEATTNNGKIVKQGIVIYKGRRRNSRAGLNLSKWLGLVRGSDKEINFRYTDARPRTTRDENDTVFKFDLYLRHPNREKTFLFESFLFDTGDVVKIDPIIHNDGKGPPP